MKRRKPTRPPQPLRCQIAEARQAAGMTQAQLAERIGQSQPNISGIERGDREPDVATLRRIAAALDRTILLNRSGPRLLDQCPHCSGEMIGGKCTECVPG